MMLSDSWSFPQVYREALLSLLGCFWHTVFDCSPSWRSDHGLKALSPDTPHFQRVTMCPLPSETNHRCVLYVAILGSHVTHHPVNISMYCMERLQNGFKRRQGISESFREVWEAKVKKTVTKMEPEKSYRGSESHHRRPRVWKQSSESSCRG